MKPPRTTPGPKLKPVQNVRYISKAAALESLEAVGHQNAVMCMQLSVLMRRYGAHIIPIAELTASEPEKLHIRRTGDEIKCWWGDDEPKAPLELVQDTDGATDAT